MHLKAAESARIYGRLDHGDGVILSQGAVLRSGGGHMTIGSQTVVLENAVLIGTEAAPLKVGAKTVFGHKCIAIGATIGHLCEIGNGTIFLPGSTVGDRCIFGEGTIIPQGAVIPSDSVVVGRPGRVIRKLTEEDREMIARMRGNDLTYDEKTEYRWEGAIGEMGKTYTLRGKHPEIGEGTVLMETAEINGDVHIGEHSFIGAGVKIIGDSHGPVKIGNNVQILEDTVLHLLPDNELIINDHVTIGPGCIIHGTTIGAHSVIESGAILCDYSQLGENTLVRSGTLVKQRSQFDANAILEGFPAKNVGTNDRRLEKPPWLFGGDREE